MKANRKSGFTLIELLVVVLIVGILASIAIPQYFKAVEKSRIAEAMSVMATIKSAQERYLAGTGASQVAFLGRFNRGHNAHGFRDSGFFHSLKVLRYGDRGQDADY